ncbi:E3 ubiquitin-protein ligase RNF5 [Acipenser ruthenus]|uniref:E3 ubiquitin-protein ligase RNF5 n=1 Tax=Acipenser ruthenus TaxID=7906 RepID=A0A444UXH2_ACIRT|nr:E3 ubiquitin-protein ligase RNF5 [Acipenser ruthenus]
MELRPIILPVVSESRCHCPILAGVGSPRLVMARIELKTPPRPQGQRTEPESRGPFQGFGDAGFHMSFGIGAFPFGGFTTVFNSNMHNHRADHNVGNPGNGNPNSWQDSLFLFVAIFFFFWLLSV